MAPWAFLSRPAGGSKKPCGDDADKNALCSKKDLGCSDQDARAAEGRGASLDCLGVTMQTAYFTRHGEDAILKPEGNERKRNIFPLEIRCGGPFGTVYEPGRGS